MRCTNNYCRHNGPYGECHVSEDLLIIGKDGVCESYEKGFQYYFYYLFRKLQSNFLCYPDIDDDIRYSIYYLMKCLPIGFCSDDIRGIVLLRHSKTKKILHRDDILQMIDDELDEEALEECIQEFITNGLPKMKEEPEVEIEYKEYGWLSPTGEYYEAEFGDHEAKARSIVWDNHWEVEYRDWQDFDSDFNDRCTYGDFLSKIKGYALIHDPSGLRRYLITHMRPLTKKQKDFLYGFFIDMNMRSRAEVYIDD